MRLTVQSYQRLQDFLRQYYGDAALRLPEIDWRVGAVARGVTQLNGISAITFGCRVLLAPHAVWQDEAGAWRIAGRLVAHEATHVLQYQRQGWGRFLYGYLSEYAQAMRQATQWNAATHFQAYANLNAEREAQAVEDAYAAWCGRASEELTL